MSRSELDLARDRLDWLENQRRYLNRANRLTKFESWLFTLIGLTVILLVSFGVVAVSSIIR